MPGPFKTALVVLTAIGSLTLGAELGSRRRHDGATVSSGGATGCCRIAIN